jgi:hypothetical protein
MKRTTIDSYISNIIETSLKSTLQKRALQEKEKQNAVTTIDEAEKSDSGEEIEKLKKGDVSVDDVIEKLNSIRSGKSFNDKDISAALGKYFDDLETPEKTALLAFLKGISQIVTGEVGGAEAIDPGDKPAGVEMEKTTDKQKVSIKPNVIKAPEVAKSKAPSSEDTSGPMPITPKKK